MQLFVHDLELAQILQWWCINKTLSFFFGNTINYSLNHCKVNLYIFLKFIWENQLLVVIWLWIHSLFDLIDKLLYWIKLVRIWCYCYELNFSFINTSNTSWVVWRLELSAINIAFVNRMTTLKEVSIVYSIKTPIVSEIVQDLFPFITTLPVSEKQIMNPIKKLRIFLDNMRLSFGCHPYHFWDFIVLKIHQRKPLIYFFNKC